jgi:arylsulfatase A-like enzyme
MADSPKPGFSREKRFFSWRTVLFAGLFLGLSVSLSDSLIVLLCRMMGSGEVTAPVTILLEPLAATTGLTLAVFALLWFVLVGPLGRFLKLEALPLVCGTAAALYALLLAVAIFGRIRQTGELAVDARLSIEFAKAGALAAAVLSAGAVYFAAGALTRSPRPVSVAGICLSLPFLLTEAFFALWLNKSFFASMQGLRIPLGKLLSTPSVVVIPGFVIAACVTVITFRKARKTGTLVQAVSGLALAAVAGSILLLSQGPGRELVGPDAATDSRVREGHPVKHVVLIVVDTLRTDALSCYGGNVPTPHIDALAADSVLFKNSYAAASWTVPSMTTLLTGLSPSVHQAIRYDSMVPYDLETLAEYMQDSGYITHAIGSQPFMANRNDFAQGFHGYDFYPKKHANSLIGWLQAGLFPEKNKAWASTEDLTDSTLAWLRTKASKDFFLWTHYYDPHMPYTPPAEFLPEGEAPPAIGDRFKGPLKSVRAGYLTPAKEEREWIRALYDGEVRHVDANVGRLLAEMKNLGIYNDSLIILTSDHGEEFWEHDGFEHGHSLYNELLSVPLLVKLPDCISKGMVDDPVSNEQVLPSILDICRINHDSKNLTNRSLPGLHITNNTQSESGPIVSTGVLYYENRESVIFGGIKYIRSLLSGREEVYDLNRDPAESTDIADASREAIEEARGILDRHGKKAEKLRAIHQLTEGQGTVMDQDALQNLKSMGYLE